jgi:hypothetical protein
MQQAAVYGMIIRIPLRFGLTDTSIIARFRIRQAGTIGIGTVATDRLRSKCRHRDRIRAGVTADVSLRSPLIKLGAT